MINFPGRKLVSYYLPRQHKEFLFRWYNKINIWDRRKVLYPKNLYISTTTYCNLRCRFCDREEFNASHIDPDNLKKIATAIKHAKQIDLTGWGEAILFKDYAKCVEYILKTNTKKEIIAQTSNGSLAHRYTKILKGRISRFVISLNSASKETYEKEMVGGKFEKTLNNINDFIQNITDSDRKNVKLHFVTYTNNFREMPDFVKLASDLNIPTVSFGQMMSNHPDEDKYTLLNVKDEYNELLEKVEEYGRRHKIEVFYRRFGENLGLNNKNCSAPFDDLYIRTDGEIAPCCYFGDKSFGNVYENDFDSIWFDKNGLISKLRKNRDFDECQVCAPFQKFDSPSVHKAPRHNQWDKGIVENYKNVGIIEDSSQESNSSMELT
jgi:MoaA/NifB/PqqE/SkfB family radical SAM enzyme